MLRRSALFSRCIRTQRGFEHLQLERHWRVHAVLSLPRTSAPKFVVKYTYCLL